MTNKSDFLAPAEVHDVLLAFPAEVRHLMPSMEDIPDEYEGRVAYEKFQARWFYEGVLESEKPPPKNGIDAVAAWRHLAAIQKSFQPKHEHKIKAVCWLMSLWFEVPA